MDAHVTPRYSRTTKSLSLGMPRKASPLLSSFIGNFTWSYIFIRHMICFAWSVLYDMSLCFLDYHNHPCCTHLLGRNPHDLEFIRILYVLHLYLLSLIVFALVLHLYLLEHGGSLILKKLLVSHASLILFWESFRTAWYFPWL